MKKSNRAGSGTDDLGLGIVGGCFKWVMVILAAISVTIMVLKGFKVF